MAFRSGLQALNDAISKAEEKAEAARAATTGGNLVYFNWKAGEKKVLRFLTDATITEEFYSFIIDKTGQTKTFMVDPADPHRLSRYMSPAPGIGWRKNFAGGVPDQPKTQEMTVGVAVLRQEVSGPDGKMVIEDVLQDRVVDGITYPSRVFGIVQQSTKLFWHTLGVSCYKRYGTICDRDYEITRIGEKFDTRYDVIPLPEVPELMSPEAVQEFYFYGQEWDEKDANRFLKCPQTVEQWATYFASEDRYKHWLVPDGAVAPAAGSGATSGLGEFRATTTHNPSEVADEAQAIPASGTKFSSLRDTLLGPEK